MASSDREYTARRDTALAPGGPVYWSAEAKIRRCGTRVLQAELTLRDPAGEARHLGVIEQALVNGEFSDADQVMDSVRDLVVCHDDSHGSAMVKSYLAGWVCADVVGRCLK